jgi:hypothetical protein
MPGSTGKTKQAPRMRSRAARTDAKSETLQKRDIAWVTKGVIDEDREWDRERHFAGEQHRLLVAAWNGAGSE